MLTERIKKHTGLPLSPYFPAAKFSWLLKHVEGAEEKAQKHELCFGTTDFEGFFEHQVPIYAVMGDSNGALFGHGELMGK